MPEQKAKKAPKAPTGAEGKEGLKGTTGAEGPEGKEGKEGAKGTSGAEGKEGKEGAKGTSGAEGKEGKEGAKGTSGAEGKEGKEGAKGTTGAEGKGGLGEYKEYVEAKAARTIATEFEVTKQTEVLAMYDREATTETTLAVSVGGTEVLSATFKSNTAGETRFYSFTVPAGKKWKITTTESKGKLTTSYLQ